LDGDACTTHAYAYGKLTSIISDHGSTFYGFVNTRAVKQKFYGKMPQPTYPQADSLYQAITPPKTSLALKGLHT